MGQKQKKPRNKAYKPKLMAGMMPIIFAMEPEKKTELAVAPLMAINLFTSGQGSEELAYTIINSILIGVELAPADDDWNAMMALIAGSDAMKRVLTRGSHGKWGFSGDDLRDITAAVTLSDELQAAATRREMRQAVHTVWVNA